MAPEPLSWNGFDYVVAGGGSGGACGGGGGVGVGGYVVVVVVVVVAIVCFNCPNANSPHGKFVSLFPRSESQPAAIE